MVKPFILKGLPLHFPPGSVLAGDLSYRATAGVLGNTCFFLVAKLTSFSRWPLLALTIRSKSILKLMFPLSIRDIAATLGKISERKI